MMRSPLPKRRKAEKMNVREPSQIRSEQHKKWVRGHVCAIAGKGEHVCIGRIEAAHVRNGGDGGTSLKPSDCRVIPLCKIGAHGLQHWIGEHSFEQTFAINMEQIAEDLWNKSPYRHDREFKRR